MIAARTGADVPRPPGDTWPDESVAFGVVWHTNYTQFPDCNSATRETRNDPPPVLYPPPTPPIPPDPASCSYSGGGGNYLSNESAYRNTLLRDRTGLTIPAGHIHTPDMQHFETDYEPSDATFDSCASRSPNRHATWSMSSPTWRRKVSRGPRLWSTR
jgi:hypothetical protein